MHRLFEIQERIYAFIRIGEHARTHAPQDHLTLQLLRTQSVQLGVKLTELFYRFEFIWCYEY